MQNIYSDNVINNCVVEKRISASTTLNIAKVWDSTFIELLEASAAGNEHWKLREISKDTVRSI